MTTTVAILGGTGPQGFGLALRLALAGHDVMIGSRDGERAAEAAVRGLSLLEGRSVAGDDIQGLRLRGLENVAAAAGAAVVVLTVPFAAQAATLKSVAQQGGLKAGQVLVDVTVPLAASVGG